MHDTFPFWKDQYCIAWHCNFTQPYELNNALQRAWGYYSAKVKLLIPWCLRWDVVQLLVWVPSPVSRAICKQFLSKKREAVCGWVGCWLVLMGPTSQHEDWSIEDCFVEYELFGVILRCFYWGGGGLSFWRGDKPASKKTPHFFWNKPPEKLWWNGCFPISLPNIFGVKALVLRETMEKQETTNNINWVTRKETNLEPKDDPIEKEKCIFQTSILGVLIRTLPKNHCWSQLVEFPLSFMRRWICTERCERSHHCASATHFNGERIEGHELVD